MTSRFYDFHDVALSVESEDAALGEAVGSRLRQFAVESGNGDGGLRFEFRFVGAVGEHRVERPPGEGRPVYEPPLGEVSYFDAEDQFFIDYGGRVRVLADAGTGTVKTSALEAERQNRWLLSRPMVTLPLVELLKRRGLFSVHAAGVVVDGKAVLIAGASGAGKSTLAVSLVRGGLGFLGDDMLFLQRNGTGLRVLSFPDEVDVSDSTVRWFPELGKLEAEARKGWPKHRLRAEETWNAPFVASAEPAIVLLPSIFYGAQSSVEEVGQEEALLELVPNVLLTEPTTSQAHLDALGELVRRSSCYRLKTARDFERLPKLVRDLVP